MGRPRKPHKVKKDQGTLNTTRDGKEPKPALSVRATESDPPAKLGTEGKKFFKKMYGKADEAGILASTDIDALVFASMCVDKFFKNYDTDEKLALQWHDRVAKWFREFGFTPATRDTITQIPKDTIDEENLFND
jgi:hypothetical protein